jgi:RHS repeat-associated protein
MKLTNSSVPPTVQETNDYGDYGELLDGTNLAPKTGSTIGNPYFFTGSRLDSETGLYYMRARYMEPRTGRFITRDPIGIWGDQANLGNGSTYVGNNPWTWTDPTGLHKRKHKAVPSYREQTVAREARKAERLLAWERGTMRADVRGDTSYTDFNGDRRGSNPFDTRIDYDKGFHVQTGTWLPSTSPSATEAQTSDPSGGPGTNVDTSEHEHNANGHPTNHSDTSGDDDPFDFTNPLNVERNLARLRTLADSQTAEQRYRWAVYFNNRAHREERERRRKATNEFIRKMSYGYAIGQIGVEGGAEGGALKYHYTTAPESSFADGLWSHTSVTDKLYTSAAEASDELGIPTPDKVIPIRDTGEFVPNSPPEVEPSGRYSGGGKDFFNPKPCPATNILPARPIR